MRFLGMACAVLMLVVFGTVAAQAQVNSAADKDDKGKQFLTVQQQYMRSVWASVDRKQAYDATVVLASPNGTASVFEMKKKEQVVRFLHRNNIDARMYRTGRGNVVQPKKKLANGSTLFLFGVKYSSKFETIALPAPVEYVQSSSLEEGAEIVLNEGVNGVALKTTVSEKDQSLNRRINGRAKKNGVKSSAIETFTVVQAPRARLVLVAAAENVTVNEGLIVGLPYPLAVHPVSSEFGMRVHPITHVYKLHDGLDFSANCGDSVAAVTGGVVSFSGTKAGYGNQIEVDHGGGFKTSYSHLSDWSVQEGDVVKTGDEVGLVGSTGYSTGCHLHFMTLVNDTPINPQGLLINE